MLVSSPAAAPWLPCSTLATTITSTHLFTRRFFLSITGKPVSKIIHAVRANGVPLQPRNSAWEDPDDGTNTDSEAEDVEGKDQWVSEAESSLHTIPLSPTVVTQYEEELIKEVEQLLEPDERAILQQNETPFLNKISTSKWGLLQSLALSGQIPLMDKLLVLGVNIDKPDKDGFTALHKAIIGKREPVISHLLRKGANPNLRDKHGATPLHYAVQVGAMQTVKLLLKYKVDVNAADDEGWTPLHVAIQSRSRDIAKVLLLNGADKTRRTNNGKTALDLSLCYGRDFKSYDLAKLVKLVPADSAI